MSDVGVTARTGAMTLNEVVTEIEERAADVRNAANARVRICLGHYGWQSRDGGAGLLWVHENVHGLVGLTEAVDIQIAWETQRR